MSKPDHLRLVEGDGTEPGGVAPSLPPPDRLLGRTIDNRYTVESLLGEGGMGLVYRARHTVLNKPLALKILRGDVSKDDEVIRRFRQEAQAATAIGNQHIIDIIDFGTLPDASTYFVMEYLDGTDLTHVIANEAPIDQARAIHIARQLGRALGAAHEAGIVHRDLKPDNIFLVKRGDDSNFVKVLDFGIAKVGSTTKKLTRQGQVFGTPHYMSPEQCAGAGTDHRTDIYALGVILYEMTTGQVPFNSETLMGILTKHMYEAPTPPSALELKKAIDPEFEAIILKCLAKDPAARYQSMGEFIRDLERLQAGLPPEAAVHGVAEFEPFPLSGVHRSLVGRPWVKWIAMGVAALAVIGSVLALSSGGSNEAIQEVQRGPERAPRAAAAPAPPTPAPGPAVERKEFRLESMPSGAEVLEKGSVVGSTPFTVVLDQGPNANEERALTLRLEGHRAKTVKMGSRITTGTVLVRLERERDSKRVDGQSADAPKASPRRSGRKKRGDGPGELLDPFDE